MPLFVCPPPFFLGGGGLRERERERGEGRGRRGGFVCVCRIEELIGE